MINKVFDRTNHRALWHWLAENPGCTKEQWPQWATIETDTYSVYNNCFACAYIGRSSCGTGEGCPLVWPEGSCQENGKAIYEIWEESIHIEERHRLALIIAELPVREGVVWK